MSCGVCSGFFGEGSFCVSCGSSKEESDRLYLLNNPKKDPVADAKAFFASKKKALKRVGIGLATAGILGGTQAFLLLGIGPEQTMDRYITAVQDGDFSALSDPSLFPGVDEGFESGLKDFRDTGATLDASYEVVEKLDDQATVKVRMAATDYELTLVPEVAYYGVFFVTEWRVITEPVAVTVAISDSLSDTQKVDLPALAAPISIKELRANTNAIGRSQPVLPGVYKANVSALGFLAETEVVKVFGAGQMGNLRLEAEVKEVANANYMQAARKATNAVKDCLRSRCSKIPKLGEYDFDLWSRYPYTKYTSSSFNKNYNFERCTQSDVIAVSPTKVRLFFTCDYTAKAHLYVRYTYYRGWYSDYYYYWNFYDSKSLSMNASVEVLTNEANTKVSVQRASIR